MDKPYRIEKQDDKTIVIKRGNGDVVGYLCNFNLKNIESLLNTAYYQGGIEAHDNMNKKMENFKTQTLK